MDKMQSIFLLGYLIGAICSGFMLNQMYRVFWKRLYKKYTDAVFEEYNEALKNGDSEMRKPKLGKCG